MVQDHRMGPKSLDRLVTEHRNLGIAAAEAIEANAAQRKYVSIYIPPVDARSPSTLTRIRKFLSEISKAGIVFAGGDFNFPEGESIIQDTEKQSSSSLLNKA